MLAQVKSLLGRQGLLNLLNEEIEKGNAFLREMAELSDGELRSTTVVLAARGLKAFQFLQWLGKAFDEERALLAAEPDHYAMFRNSDATVTVVERLGLHASRVLLPAFDAAPDWVPETAGDLLPESEYPFRRIAAITLPDGTVVGRMLTQFGDTDDGFTANITAYFPAACSEEFFEHHRQHIAVEFTNWITAAAAAQKGDGSNV
ncbi:MAG TPA: hypothetical protein VGE11_08915 [Pseudonocardia sp.]